MLFRFFALFLLLLLPSNAISSRILVSVAADSKSHLRSALPLINRLGSAGHEVHVFCITSEPVKEAFDPNVTLLKVPVESKIESAVQNMGTHIWRQTMHTPMMFAVYYMISQNFVELVNNQPEKLAAVLNSEWDLVIAGSFFSLHAYAFAQILHQQRKVPYAMFGTSMVLNSDAYSITMGRSWLIHPHPFSNTPAHATDGFDPKCVMHRLVNVLENAAELTTNIITG